MCQFYSTILEEEKLQQEERLRMEMRRQVTVSWDSGGSDEAPPKVRQNDNINNNAFYLSFIVFSLSNCFCILLPVAQQTRLPQSSVQ